MMQKGIETDNILILSSFSRPVDREEIKPYISGVLKDLKLEEKVTENYIITNCYYHVQQITEEYEIRKNLSSLFNLHLENNYSEYTNPFYLLYYAWIDLEREGINYYYDGVTLNNIKSIVKLESQKYIAKYVNNDEFKTNEIEAKLAEITNQTESTKSNFWSKIMNKLKGNNDM
jgi:hypothetical protein